jgi:hypothetical protein
MKEFCPSSMSVGIPSCRASLREEDFSETVERVEADGWPAAPIIVLGDPSACSP